MQTNLTELFRLAMDRAEDETFLTALRADPKAALTRTFGVTFVDRGGELDDADLDEVVGGVSIQDFQGLVAKRGEAFDLMSDFFRRLQQQGTLVVGRLP